MNKKTLDVEIEIFAKLLVEEKLKMLVEMYKKGEIERHQIKTLLLNKKD